MSFATSQGVAELQRNANSSVGGLNQKLDSIITGVNAKIEAELNRVLLQAEQTEYFDLEWNDSNEVKLHGYPILAAPDPVLTLNGNILTTDQYSLKKSTGSILIKVGWVPDLEALEVVYTGGMAATEEELRTKFPQITYEANLQAMFEMNRMVNIDSKSRDSGGRGNVENSQVYEKFKLRDELLTAIHKHSYKLGVC